MKTTPSCLFLNLLYTYLLQAQTGSQIDSIVLILESLQQGVVISVLPTNEKLTV